MPGQRRREHPETTTTDAKVRNDAAHQPAGRVSCTRILRDTVDGTGFGDLYRREVLAQKTRTIRLPGRKNPARVLHTLLGFEVKACGRRMQCPDLVTARYLRLFSELGCRAIKLPYDPTRTARWIPEFEAMLERILSRVQALLPEDGRRRQAVVRHLYAILRRQLHDA